MKKLFLLTTCLVTICTMVFADYSIDWVRTADIFTNTGTSVARDASDNVYTTTSNGSIYLEKRDRFGNLLWQVNSSTTIQFNYEYPVMVHINPQGYPVVVGYRYTISSEGHFANSLIVLKYDPNGNLVYKKNFDGTYTYFNNSQYWTKVTSQMDAAGNVYIGTAGHVNGYPEWGFNAIKITPSGNIHHVSTKSFASSTSFHFVNQIRLKGNRLGLTGVTSYSSANATTWVVDTAGNNIWSNIVTGIQGKDIAFDNSGNAYMLTWVSVSFSGDVALYKFNASGTQAWYHAYNFGGSDLASRMEMTPDGNLAIMAYGNQAPGISYYVDWITMKVNLSGTLLWSDRYNETSNNDEIPSMLAVDANNNVFVTGIGGPFPGGSNLGARQMVTVKYSPSGMRQWVSAIDTLNEYNTGIGISIASDGSLYVMGNVNTFIVHYLDHTGTDPCNIPINVTASALTDDAATINWSTVADAYLYHIQYRTAGSATWQKISTDATSFTLTSLFPGTTYQYQVEAVCNSGPTGYSAIQQFITMGAGYCASMGLDGSKEWIDLVYLGTMLNSTPVSDGGYADYTYLSTDLIQGGTYDITLSADMSVFNSKTWRVWIDYNQDGDFIDPGEKEVGYKSSQVGWETHTFKLPANAHLGETRMRVSMKRGGPGQNPCEIFAHGEVEDYTVNIIPAKMELPEELSNMVNPEVSIYPNPGANMLNVSLSNWNGILSFEVFDLTGRRIYFERSAADNLNQINAAPWAKGTYLLRVSDDAGNRSMLKWIKE